MSFSIDKVWTTQQGRDIWTISLKSKYPNIPEKRIRVDSSLFPQNPTTDNPLNHVLLLQMLDSEDLEKIATAILDALYGEGGYVVETF